MVGIELALIYGTYRHRGNPNSNYILFLRKAVSREGYRTGGKK